MSAADTPGRGLLISGAFLRRERPRRHAYPAVVWSRGVSRDYHINSRIRGIVDRPIVELVEVGMERRRDATRLLSFQYVLRLGDDVSGS